MSNFYFFRQFIQAKVKVLYVSQKGLEENLIQKKTYLLKQVIFSLKSTY